MIELKGPSASEIKNFIKEKNLVEFHLINEKTLVGQVLWYDENAFHVQEENGKIITLLKRAVISYSKIK